MAQVAEKLAIDGGPAVRAEPLPYGRGASLWGEEERAAVLRVMDRHGGIFRYSAGDEAEALVFEDLLRKTLQVPHAVATSSGTSALRVALAALGIGCGDEVIVPAFTFIATVNAVVVAGAVPVFAEVDDTLGLDPRDVEARITPRTRAIIPVHIEGGACDMDPLLEVARRHQLRVLEDTAQSMGGTYKGRVLGTIGDIGAFSLQEGKMAATGEGGAVVTSSEELHVRAERYHDQGAQFITTHGTTRGGEQARPFVGENLRMTNLQGAIGAVQMRRLPGLVRDLRAVREKVLAAVGDVPGLELRRSPDPAGETGATIIWYLPTAELASRFGAALNAEGVPFAGTLYGAPVYATPAILAKGTASGKGGPWNCAEHPCQVEYQMGMCPRTEDLAQRNLWLSLGCYSDAECDDLVTAIHKVAAHVLA